MKTTFAIVLWFFVGAYGTIQAQTVLQTTTSIHLENKAISDVLLALSETSDVNITFSPNFFRADQRASIRAQNTPLEKLLNEVLKDTGVGFRVSGQGVVLFRKEPTRYTISGYISDAESGERLVGANVVAYQRQQGGASNAYGFYSQTHPAGQVSLQVSYLGYQTQTIVLDLQKSTQVNVALVPSLTLQEIVVLSTTDSSMSMQPGQEPTLPLAWLSHLPATGGEVDIVRSLQLLPGVHTGGDGFGGLHVRGGNSDQNLILFDDVPIYNPSHTFGLFSIFNPDIVKSVKFYKGGFPARYDGRLSSVLDVRTREGNDQRFAAAASVGTLASRVVVEAPIAQGKGGILLAGRRTHINSWLQPLSNRRKLERGEMGQMNYSFVDVNAKVHYTLDQKNKLYLSCYNGADRFDNHSRVDMLEIELEDEGGGGNEPLTFFYSANGNGTIDWGNRILSLRWNRLYNDKLFSNTTATLSRFKYRSTRQIEEQVTIFEEDLQAVRYVSDYSSIIKDYSLRTDFDWYAHHQHHFRFGANSVYRSFVPGLSEIRATGNDLDNISEIDQSNLEENDAIRTLETSVYLEDEFTHQRLSIIGGMRLSSFTSGQQTRLLVQPRLAAHYRLSDFLHLSSSLSRTSQFVHLLTRTDSGLPNDMWVPASADAPPQRAWQAVVGLAGTIGKNWQWSLEGYWKSMNKLFRIQRDKFEGELGSLNDLRIDANNWENFVEEGQGQSVGVEGTLEYQRGRFVHWLGYAYAKTKRKFSGTEERYPYDSRHSVTLATTYQITGKWGLSCQWIYQSGRPFSLDNFGEGDVPFLLLLGASEVSTETDRFPSYHRLDASFYLHLGEGRLLHKIQLGVSNAYNRKNPFFASYIPGSTNAQIVHGLPILPAVSYTLQW